MVDGLHNGQRSRRSNLSSRYNAILGFFFQFVYIVYIVLIVLIGSLSFELRRPPGCLGPADFASCALNGCRATYVSPSLCPFEFACT